MRCALVLALLLAADSAMAGADELDGSYQSLQKAASKKDPGLVKKRAAQITLLGGLSE
jgi:hypothetical protein